MRADPIGRDGGQPRVPHLPAVTERALEHRRTPQLGNTRQVGRAVLHAGREQHTTGSNLLTATHPQDEPVTDAMPATNLPTAVFDARIGRQLLPPRLVQLGRPSPVESEQTPDDVRRPVALLPGVDDHRPPTGSPQYQRGTQSRGACADDGALPPLIHVWVIPASTSFMHVDRAESR